MHLCILACSQARDERLPVTVLSGFRLWAGRPNPFPEIRMVEQVAG